MKSVAQNRMTSVLPHLFPCTEVYFCHVFVIYLHQTYIKGRELTRYSCSYLRMVSSSAITTHLMSGMDGAIRAICFKMAIVFPQ